MPIIPRCETAHCLLEPFFTDGFLGYQPRNPCLMALSVLMLGIKYKRAAETPLVVLLGTFLPPDWHLCSLEENTKYQPQPHHIQLFPVSSVFVKTFPL